MTSGGYDFRGAEITVTGKINLKGDELQLVGPDWSIRLAAIDGVEKLQWDWSQQQAASPSAAELAAYSELRKYIDANADPSLVTVTGPFSVEGSQQTLYVRRATH